MPTTLTHSPTVKFAGTEVDPEKLIDFRTEAALTCM